MSSSELDSDENEENAEEATFDGDDIISSHNDVTNTPNGVTNSPYDVINSPYDVTNSPNNENRNPEIEIDEKSDFEIHEPNVHQITGFSETESNETSHEEVLDSKPEVNITLDFFLDKDLQLPEELLIDEITDYETDDASDNSGANSGPGTPILENETGKLDSINKDNKIDSLSGTGTKRSSVVEKDPAIKESPGSNPSQITIKEVFPEERIVDKRTRQGRAKKSAQFDGNLEVLENLRFERKKRSELLTGAEVTDLASTESEEEYPDLSSIEEHLSGIKTTYSSKSEEDQLDVGSSSPVDILPEETLTVVETTTPSSSVIEPDQTENENSSLSSVHIIIEKQSPAEVSNEEKHWEEKDKKLEISEDDSAFLGGRKNPRFERTKIPSPIPAEDEVKFNQGPDCQ